MYVTCVQVDGLSLLTACISHWLVRSADQCPHVLLATNFHSLLQLGLLPFSPMLSLLVSVAHVDVHVGNLGLQKGLLCIFCFLNTTK